MDDVEAQTGEPDISGRFLVESLFELGAERGRPGPPRFRPRPAGSGDRPLGPLRRARLLRPYAWARAFSWRFLSSKCRPAARQRR